MSGHQAVFEAIKEDDVLQNSMDRASDVRNHIAKINSDMPGLIREVRGRGLMIGIEFNAFGDDSYFGAKAEMPTAYGQFAAAVAKTCWDNNLLVLACGPYDTLRLIPPLNISKTDLEECLDVFCSAVQKTADDFK